MSPRHKLYWSIFALIAGSTGIIIMFVVNWRFATGVMLFMWSENMFRDKVK